MPYPTQENYLYLFIASLSIRMCSFSTAKTYLAGISFANELRGFRPNFKLMLLVQRALQGLRRSDSPMQARLPITIDILHLLYISLAQSSLSAFDRLGLWACFTVAFFGFFRIGELLPSQANNHILSSDVSLWASGLILNLRKSKTDPMGKGSLIRITPSGRHLCAVTAMQAYFPDRQARFPPGPVFLNMKGQPFTPAWFNMQLKELLGIAGISSHRFSSHSFRAGAATTAAAMGVPDWLIKALGRWSSDAYQIYISTPQSTLAGVPSTLCAALFSGPSPAAPVYAVLPSAR